MLTLSRARARPRAGARTRVHWGTLGRHAAILLALGVILVPLGWAVLLSLSPPRAPLQATLLPQTLDGSAYLGVLRRTSSLSGNLINSVLVTAATVLLTVACATLAGYALAFLHPAGRVVVAGLLVASLIFPTRIVSALAVWQIQRGLGLLNQTWALLLPYSTLTLALGVLLMRAVFQQAGTEAVEAARLDGAGPLRVLWSILLPQVRAGMALVAAATFVAAWGEYLVAALLLDDQSRRTLTVVLGSLGGPPRPGSAAFWVVSILPSVLMAVGLQRWVLRGTLERTRH